jgi:hypothetical protein
LQTVRRSDIEQQYKNLHMYIHLHVVQLSSIVLSNTAYQCKGATFRIRLQRIVF